MHTAHKAQQEHTHAKKARTEHIHAQAAWQCHHPADSCPRADSCPHAPRAHTGSRPTAAGRLARPLFGSLFSASTRASSASKYLRRGQKEDTALPETTTRNVMTKSVKVCARILGGQCGQRHTCTDCEGMRACGRTFAFKADTQLLIDVVVVGVTSTSVSTTAERGSSSGASHLCTHMDSIARW